MSKDMIAVAHEMGRERCQWLAEEQHKGGLPYYPIEWAMSDCDVDGALMQLGIECGSTVAPVAIAALKDGFAERRDELQAGISDVAQAMIDADIAAWRAGGELAGMVDRARRAKLIRCNWTTRAIHDAGCLFYEPARWSYEKHIRRALIAVQ